MRRVPLVAVLAVSLVLLFGPAGPASDAVPTGSDKVVHVLLFAALAWTGRLAGVPLPPLGLALLAYAGLSEVLQSSVPWAERTSSWADVAADAAGIALGLLLPQPRARGRGRQSLGRTNL